MTLLLRNPDRQPKSITIGSRWNLPAHSALVRRARNGGNPLQSQFDADYWRKRAYEAHSAAQAMTDLAAKREMHFIAEAYERLADHAERTARRKKTA